MSACTLSVLKIRVGHSAATIMDRVNTDRVFDPDLERIERIECELQFLHQRLDSTVLQSNSQTSPAVSHSIGSAATEPDANVFVGRQAWSFHNNGSGLPIANGSTNQSHSQSGRSLLGFDVRKSSCIDAVAAG